MRRRSRFLVRDIGAWRISLRTAGQLVDRFVARRRVTVPREVLPRGVSGREIEPSDQVFDWAAIEQRHLARISAAYPDASFVLRIVADPDGVASGIHGWYLGGDPERDYPLFLE